MQEILVILNPAARSERAKNTWKKIERFPNCTLRTTTAPGDALRVAAEAVEEGFTTIVAAGGDGTVNDVVNGIAGKDVSLGILPVGTMNVFAAELGLPSDLDEAWAVIRAGRTRKIDLVRANARYFIQLAGVGLDAQVVQETSWNFKKNFGPLSYVISAAQIAARKPPRLVVEADGVEREGSFVLLGNGRYYGGPLAFFKEARIDDGKLDVLIFKNLGYLDIARYLGTILMGKHTDLPDVEYFQTKKVLVRSEEDVPVEVDGEVAMQLPVTFRISSRKLRVVVPVAPEE
jgi:YegS/Rv2252/BmrU family lipid kinase